VTNKCNATYFHLTTYHGHLTHYNIMLL